MRQQPCWSSDYYSPAAAVPASALNDAARITVRAPRDAEVWFENAKTATSGPVREFRSPRLTPGGRYAYDVRARWTEGGRTVTQTQHAAVGAGPHVTVLVTRRAHPEPSDPTPP